AHRPGASRDARATGHGGRADRGPGQPRPSASPPVLARLGAGARAREHGAGLALDLPWRPPDLRDQGRKTLAGGAGDAVAAVATAPLSLLHGIALGADAGAPADLD